MCKLTEQTIEWTNTSDQQITQADAGDYIRGCVSGMRDRYHIKAESQKSEENHASNVPHPDEESPCADRESPPNNYQTFSEAPLVAQAASKLTFVTNCGSISVKLDKQAPVTSQIMTNLALKQYFDHSPCHRLTTEGIFILQCGDPHGDGTGGPGFTFADENLPSTAESAKFNYQRGTVAMANSGPDTNGSQFFVVYDTSPLQPNYSIWGHVTSGMSTIDAIAKRGVSTGSTDGTPSLNVQIESVNVN